VLALAPPRGPQTRVEPPFAADVVPGAEPTVRVSGPIDITTADQLAIAIRNASRGGTVAVAVDLRAVDQLASAGVRVLHDAADQPGVRLRLLATRGSAPHAVLRLVELDQLVDESSDVQAS
jgi:anti-anti-sigma factor